MYSTCVILALWTLQYIVILFERSHKLTHNYVFVSTLPSDLKQVMTVNTKNGARLSFVHIIHLQLKSSHMFDVYSNLPEYLIKSVFA